MNISCKISVVSTALVLISIISLFGCNGGTLTPGDDNQTNGFRLGFALVRDVGTNSTMAIAGFQQNDSAITNATIMMQNNNLIFSSFRYLFESASANTIPTGPIVVTAEWISFSDTVDLTVTDTFTIASVLPPVKGPGDRVFVDWSGSAGTETYVIAAVKRDSAYLGIGFSQYVTSLTTSETVEDSAFTITTLSGAEPNPGMYNIYIYALSGSPDSALTSIELPVPLPSQLTENVTKPDFKAFGGTITISAPITIEVVAAP